MSDIELPFLPVLERDGLTKVKNIILVSSGKGGVGKSTVTSNLASALHVLGHKVGVLDADIYGPSQNMMFGIPNNTPVVPSEDPRYVLPNESKGIKVASIASRINENQSVSWRGPMVSMALINMIFFTNWGELDYLVVDMPPGTGDVQISICEKLHDAKVVIVTTPQDVALIDCKKGIDMYINNKLEILGIVENMSGHVCSCCGNVDYIFGSDGGDKLADEYNTKVLGKLPIATNIRVNADEGTPITLSDPENSLSKIYISIAEKVTSNE